ncbi:MAG: polysaccharide pyruvyl transferase family protein [Syntrophobacterales bacterium]|nr:polysaccharide pyruvyl transferase family protein [Syntrophobacterales bacterium]
MTIDTPESNRGNRLIEYAIKKVLGLPEPSVSIPMFVNPRRFQIDQINQCDFILLPGATILAKGKGQGEAMNSLKKMKPPKFCIGAGGWHPLFKLNFKAMKHIDGSLGIRDLHTYDQCKKAGVPVKFIGCPTMLLPEVKESSVIPYDIIGFARKYVDWQINDLFKPLSVNRDKRLVASLQEAACELPIAQQITKHVFNYDDPADVMRQYAGADFVCTGRLHGVLPAISQKKPVIFFGNPNDKRFTLLSYLGVPVNELGSDPLKFKPVNSSVYSKNLSTLRDKLNEWKKETIDLI